MYLRQSHTRLETLIMVGELLRIGGFLSFLPETSFGAIFKFE
jgi:hypothetical protein